MNHREAWILALGSKVKHHSFKVSKILNVKWDVNLSEISWYLRMKKNLKIFRRERIGKK